VDEHQEKENGSTTTAALNSIMYLTDDEAAPTVILNQSVPEGMDCRIWFACRSTPAVPQEGVVVYPQINRRAVFWSRAAHGVIPQLALGNIDKNKTIYRRTLVINWWFVKPRAISSLTDRDVDKLGYRPLQNAVVMIPGEAQEIKAQELSLDGPLQRIALQGADIAAFSLALPIFVRGGVFRWKWEHCDTHWAINFDSWDPFWGSFDPFSIMATIPTAKLVVLDGEYLSGGWSDVGALVDRAVSKHSDSLVTILARSSAQHLMEYWKLDETIQVVIYEGYRVADKIEKLHVFPHRVTNDSKHLLDDWLERYVSGKCAALNDCLKPSRLQ